MTGHVGQCESGLHAGQESPLHVRGCPDDYPIFCTLSNGFGGSDQGARGDTDDGSQLVNVWTNQTNNPGVRCAVKGSAAYFSYGVGVGSKPVLRRVNRSTGTTAWSTTDSDWLTSSTGALDIRATSGFVWMLQANTAGVTTIYLYNASTGAFVWKYPFASGVGPSQIYVDGSTLDVWYCKADGGAATTHLESVDIDGNLDVSIDITAITNGNVQGWIAPVEAGGDFLIKGFDGVANDTHVRITRSGSSVWSVTVGAVFNFVGFVSGSFYYSFLFGGRTVQRRAIASGTLVASTSVGTGGQLFCICPGPDGHVYAAGGNDSSGNNIYRVNVGTSVVWSDDRNTGSGSFNRILTDETPCFG